VQVVDGHERQPAGGGERLGGRDTDQQGADQTRPLGDGHALDVVEGGAGAGERVIDDGVDELEVVARRDLRHHAAEARVHALRGDDVRADLARGGDDGGAGVVAGGLDREDHAAGCVRHMITASSPLSA
jgi:hypothetical protein